MSLLDVFLRRVVLHGSLTVVDHQGNAKTFGTSGSEYPDVTIRLNDSGVAGAIVRNPTLGAGEAYMDGRFSVDDDDIMGLLELVQANTRWESGRPLERSGLLKRSEEHTSELQSLIRISSAVFCMKNKKS